MRWFPKFSNNKQKKIPAGFLKPNKYYIVDGEVLQFERMLDERPVKGIDGKYNFRYTLQFKGDKTITAYIGDAYEPAPEPALTPAAPVPAPEKKESLDIIFEGGKKSSTRKQKTRRRRKARKSRRHK